MSHNRPELLVSSQDYFSELLEPVLKDINKFEIHPFSKIYLAELLNNFLHVDSLFTKDEAGKTDTKMLCERLLETQNGSNINKVYKLKQLAETTLYVSGFFASSLNRKLVNQSYYIQIGTMVYANLSHLVDKEVNSGLYQHFSNNFLNYADVLTEVSHKANIQKSNDVLEIFDRYLDSGSKWAEKLLVQNGISLTPLKKTAN